MTIQAELNAITTAGSEDTNALTATGGDSSESDSTQTSDGNAGASNDTSTTDSNTASASGDASGDNDTSTDGNTEAQQGGDGKKTPWFQRRIDALTAEKWDERRKNEALQAQTAALLEQLAETRRTNSAVQQTATTEVQPQTSTTRPPESRTSMTEAEINALAERKALEIAARTQFNKTCNDVYNKGKDEFNDFDQKLSTFKMLGGMPTQLLEIANELKDAHKVLYALGKDPDLAERVVKLPPAKMALELARIEAGFSKPAAAAVSKAPPPIRTVDSGSRAQSNPETMTTQQWIEWREKQLKERNGR